MIKKLTSILFGSSTPFKQSDGFSNKKLVKMVEDVFTQILIRDSLDDRLIYDSNFMIVVSSEIYDRVSLQAPFIAQSIVKRFYKVIEKHMVNKDEFVPCSTHWHIQFVSGEHITNQEESQGEVEIFSQFAVKTNWVDMFTSEVSSGSVSLNGKHSRYSNWAINPEIMNNVDVLEKGFVRIPFDLGGNTAFENKEGVRKTEKHLLNEELAEIQFEQDGRTLAFKMTTQKLTIGKATSKNDKLQREKLVIHSDNPGLKEDHMQIQYDADSRIFYIAVYANTVVNGEQVKVSYSTDNPTWHSLKQESNIMCGLYRIYFKALK